MSVILTCMPSNLVRYRHAQSYLFRKPYKNVMLCNVMNRHEGKTRTIPNLPVQLQALSQKSTCSQNLFPG